MNFSDLSHLELKDLQKLDYKKLLGDLKKRKDIFASVLIGGLAFLIVINIFAKGFKEAGKLNGEAKKLELKLAAVESYNRTKKDLAEFLEKVPPPIHEDKLVNQIMDFAEMYNIHIGSISPVTTSKKGLYEKSSVSLNISANNYSSLWLFINDIEHFPSLLLIDRWDGGGEVNSPALQQQMLSAAPQDKPVQVRIDIATIKIKNE